MYNPELIVVAVTDCDDQVDQTANDELLSADSCCDIADDEISSAKGRTPSALSLSSSSKRGDTLGLSEIGSVIGSSQFLSSINFLNRDDHITDSQRLDAIAAAPSLEYLDTVMSNSEYIDTLQGRIPLAKAARMIASDRSKHAEIFSASRVRQMRNECYRKLCIIGAAYLCLFSSSFALRNLQSSLPGFDPSLGLVTFGCLRSLTWFGGLIASPIISKIRPKRTMVIAATIFCLYPVSNFYPTAYTMIPSALLCGFGTGLIFSAGGVYMINLSAKYALASKRSLTDVVGKFNSVIAMMFQSSHLLGNLLSSVILSDRINWFPESQQIVQEDGELSTIANNSMNSNHTQETLVCGLDFYSVDQHIETTRQTDSRQYLILFGVYTALPLIGLAFCVALKPLQTMTKMDNNNIVQITKQFLKMFVNSKMLLVSIPCSLYLGMAMSITTADYTKTFVTCAYGVNYIGYILLTAAVFRIAGAFVPGRIISKTGRIPIFLTASLAGTSSFLLMLLWEPRVGSMQPTAFLPVALWSLTDAILLTQIVGFMGEMFRTELVFAFSVHHFCYGVGNMFATFSSAFQLLSMSYLIYIALAILWISFVLFICFESLHRHRK